MFCISKNVENPCSIKGFSFSSNTDTPGRVELSNKNFKKTLKKVLTNGFRFDIICKHSRERERKSAKRTLKIKQR